MHFRHFILLLFLPFVARPQSTQQLVDSANKYKANNFHKAIQFAYEAYQKASDEKNYRLMAAGASANAHAQYLTGNRDESLKWRLEAIKIFNNLNDTPNLAREYAEICVLYVKLKKYDKADEVSKIALQYARSIKDANLLATASNNRGLMFLDEHILDSALMSFSNGYQYYKLLHSNIGMAYSLDYMASTMAEKGNITVARKYLEECAVLRTKTNDKMGEAVTLNNIGELLVLEKKYKEAIGYFNAAREKATVLKFTDLEANTYKMEADAWNKLGENGRAYATLVQYQLTNEKVPNEKQLNAIEDLQTKYETDKKEQQNRLLTEQNRVQALMLNKRKITIISLLIATLLIVGISYLLYTRYKIQQEKHLQQELLNQQQLRAQAIMETEENERQRLARELHDGVGQLLSAARRKTESAMMNSLSKDEILALQDESIKEIRQLSHNMMPPYLRDRSLMQAIDDLVLRIKQTILLNIKTEWIDTDELILGKTETLMLYRAIQEMMSNIIKHAEATNVI